MASSQRSAASSRPCRTDQFQFGAVQLSSLKGSPDAVGELLIYVPLRRRELAAACSEDQRSIMSVSKRQSEPTRKPGICLVRRRR